MKSVSPGPEASVAEGIWDILLHVGKAGTGECLAEVLTFDWSIPGVHAHMCVRKCVLSCYSLPYSLETGCLTECGSSVRAWHAPERDLPASTLNKLELGACVWASEASCVEQGI